MVSHRRHRPTSAPVSGDSHLPLVTEALQSPQLMKPQPPYLLTGTPNQLGAGSLFLISFPSFLVKAHPKRPFLSHYCRATGHTHSRAHAALSRAQNVLLMPPATSLGSGALWGCLQRLLGASPPPLPSSPPARLCSRQDVGDWHDNYHSHGMTARGIWAPQLFL